MKTHRLPVLALFALTLNGPALAQKAPSADEIMQKSESARRIPQLKAEGLLATSGDGAPSDKTFLFSRKLTSDGTRFRTLTRFKTPATVRDQAILFLERDSDSSDIFMYLPNFKKTRRVESHAQSGSFMGTAFSYSDIANPHAEDYTHKLLKSEKCPGGANNCFVVESTPRTAGVKERTGYSKSVQWIDSVSYLPVKGEFYDAKTQKLRKQMVSSDIQAVGAKKAHYLAHRSEITDLTNGRKSRLVFSKVNVDENLRDNLFTQAALESP